MRGCEFRSGGRGGLRPSWGRRREAFVASGVAMKGSIRAPCRPEQGRRAWDGRAGSGEQKAWDSTAALAREGGSRQARPSYAAVVAAGRVSRSAFPDLAIPPRRVQRRDGNPLVLFSEDEVRPAYSDMANAVILKFAESRPSVAAVKEYLRRRELIHIPVIGALDGRHCLVICRSEGDAVEVLTSDSNRIGDFSFRTFRWLPGFTTKAEPTIMVTWVRLKGLDPCLFRPGFLKEVCRGFGRFLRADPDTLNLINPGVAKVCVEIDARHPLARGMWVGTERRQQWIDIEYEGRVNYYFRCKKQGHNIEHCRREIARHHRAVDMRVQRFAVRKESSAKGCSVSVRVAGATKGASEEGQWHTQRRKTR